MRASVRQMLADHIERRIDLLDALDGDADFEPDCDDQPSLAYAVYHTAVGWTLSDDREGDDSDYGEILGCARRAPLTRSRSGQSGSRRQAA